MKKTEAPPPEPRPRGRPAMLGEGAVRTNIYLSRAQHEKLALLGGSAWLRAQIDKAKLPR